MVLAVYDISNDRRRTKLHNLLCNYGTPVQYSVFECLLTPEEKEKMMKAALKIIRKKADSLRFYSLCAECAKKISGNGKEEMPPQKDQALVI